MNLQVVVAQDDGGGVGCGGRAVVGGVDGKERVGQYLFLFGLCRLFGLALLLLRYFLLPGRLLSAVPETETDEYGHNKDEADDGVFIHGDGMGLNG